MSGSEMMKNFISREDDLKKAEARIAAVLTAAWIGNHTEILSLEQIADQWKEMCGLLKDRRDPL